MAFRRFVSRHGVPLEVISDNAVHFKLASKTIETILKDIILSEEVQSYVFTSGVNWHFIVEQAPWMAGFYESLVTLVKRALRNPWQDHFFR